MPVAGTELTTNLVAVADTCLYEVAPTNNLGVVTELPFGVHSSGKRSRLLLKFDPASALPAGARVVAAELTLTVTTANSGSLPCNLYRMLRDWAEGAGFGTGNGASAADGETTWLARFHPAALWDWPGGSAGTDFAASPSASAVIGGAGSTNVVTASALAADVQAWLDDPTSNFGWLLLAADEATVQTARRIRSRETVSNPPRLALRFHACPRLSQPVFENGVFSFVFEADSNLAYRVDYRPSFATGAWQTLTNIAPLPEPATVRVTDRTSDTSCFYRVRFH